MKLSKIAKYTAATFAAVMIGALAFDIVNPPAQVAYVPAQTPTEKLQAAIDASGKTASAQVLLDNAKKHSPHLEERILVNLLIDLVSLQKIHVKDVERAYKRNTVAADQEYKGKRFAMDIKIEDISTDFAGDPYVTAKGSMFVQFPITEDPTKLLQDAEPGMGVTVMCTGAGDIAKIPLFRNCTIG